MQRLLRILGFVLCAAAPIPAQNLHYVATGQGGAIMGVLEGVYYSVDFTETDLKGKDKGRGAWITLYRCSYNAQSHECLGATGPLPADTIKVVGKTAVFYTPDLTAHVGMEIWRTLCQVDDCEQFDRLPAPLPVRVELRVTDIYRSDYHGKQTLRRIFPDGTELSQSSQGGSSVTSAAGRAVIGSLPLPPGTGEISEHKAVYRIVNRTPRQAK